jgi:peptidoglycan/LPS O-acetylase OafA/YrhL
MASAPERVEKSDNGRLASLDALRGVAALAVVLFHVCIPLGVIVAPNGYLAVDFFFLLSGYVLAHAYGAQLRAGRLGPASFIGIRLARLYPLALLGVLIGVSVGVVMYAPMLHGAGATEFAGTAAANLLVLPLGKLSYTHDHPLFAFNTPVWSLFWELVINGVYVAIAPHLGAKALGILTGLAGLALVAIAVTHGSLQAGAEAASFGAGAARVGFSFFCGVALNRLLQRPLLANLHASPMLAAGMLGLVLLSPMLIGSWIFDPVAVVLVFPAILVLALRGEPTGSARQAALFVGDLSYPLYVTHFPVVRLFLYLIGPQKPAGETRALVIATELAAIAAVSVLALVLYDRPIRSWLRHRRRTPMDPTVRSGAVRHKGSPPALRRA